MKQRISASIGLALVALLLASCGGPGVTQHPLTNALDPAYTTFTAKTLAGLPFYSDISEQDDPDGLAAGMVESKFYRALTAAPTGFTVLSSAEVQRTVDSQQWGDAMTKFYRDWTNDQEGGDADFIKRVAAAMKAEAVIAGVVDVWSQHPIDITESGTARTQVGMLIGLFDGTTGKRIWLGRDENFKEALRYSAGAETGDVARTQQEREMERTNLRTAGGAYAPPDYDGVVDLVVGPLVAAFPKHR
jgi:hypothetical protein